MSDSDPGIIPKLSAVLPDYFSYPLISLTSSLSNSNNFLHRRRHQQCRETMKRV